MPTAHVATVDLPGRIGPDAFRSGEILFIGTATTVIAYGGFTLLTDPNFLHAGDHVHLGYGMTTPRLTNPALEIEELPPLDACVLSHLHGDHWDRVAEEKLRRDLPIVTTTHAARRLAQRGFARMVGLDTWQSALLTKTGGALRITAVPARHGPPLVHRALPPTMGSILEWSRDAGSPAFRLWISGDTLVHERLHEIPKRYPDIPLALLHLGGTRILGVLLTLDAKQGVEALRIVRPRRAIPIHYDDYPVFRSSLEDFLAAVRDSRVDTDVAVLRRGERLRFDVEAPRRDEARPAT